MKEVDRWKLSLLARWAILISLMAFCIATCARMKPPPGDENKLAFEAVCSSIDKLTGKIDELVKSNKELQEKVNKSLQRTEVKTGGKTIAKRKVMVTTYQATKRQCGNSKGITFSGKPVRKGIVAVTPSMLRDGWKIGKKVFIPGHGKYEIADRTHPKHRNLVDIYEPNPSKNFTKKGVTVYLLSS